MGARKTVPFEYDGIKLEAYVDGPLDMRIYDTAAEYGPTHVVTVRATAVAMLGADGYKALCDALRERHGVAKADDVLDAITAATQAVGAKN